MIVIYLLLAFLAAVCIGGICYIIYRHEELDEWEDELSKYSVHLDERANKLAMWEQQLSEANIKEHDDGKLFSVVYCVSDYDEIRFTTEDAMVRNAKKHMAHTIANDIIHSFDPMRSEDGKKLTYELMIKQ